MAGWGIAAAAQLERSLPAAAGTLLGRQAQDAEPLQFLEQALGALQAVAAVRRLPLQVLAEGVSQFRAAQLREASDGFLDVGNLPPGQALAEEGGGFEILDQRVQCESLPRPKLAEKRA